MAWTKVDNALDYTLYYKESTAKNFVKRIVAKTSTTYYGIKGKTYEFYVVANPKCGSDFSASDVSATRTITLDGNNVVNPPVNPPVAPTKTPIAAPVLSAKVNGTTITVSWNAADKARGYKVFWKVKGASGDYQASNEINGTSYQITGVAKQSYEIYAVAYPTYVAANDNRQSENSKTVTATIPKQENPPVNLTPLPSLRDDKTTYFNFSNPKAFSLNAYVYIPTSDWNFDTLPVIEFQFRKSGDTKWSRSELGVRTTLLEYPRPFSLAYAYSLQDWNGEGLKAGDCYECRARLKATDEFRNAGYTDSDWTTVREAQALNRNNGGNTQN